jgi:hypothetical protein
MESDSMAKVREQVEAEFENIERTLAEYCKTLNITAARF